MEVQRHWVRTIIRLLNVAEEQLMEYFVRGDEPSTANDLRLAQKSLRDAVRSLNSVFDTLQDKGK